MTRVRMIRSGEWAGDSPEGNVLVRGPYRGVALTQRMAHELGGVRGGAYVVYSTGRTKPSPIVDTVAGCLGPGVSAYTF